MHYGYIGLGNLGGHLAASLIRAGHQVTVFDRNPAHAERHRSLGAQVAGSVTELAGQVDEAVQELLAPKAPPCQSIGDQQAEGQADNGGPEGDAQG